MYRWLGVLVLVAAALSRLTACGPPALPTTETGEGRTDELDAALARHDLQLPEDASQISYTLHSSIDSDEVAVRFVTTADGVSDFMESRSLADAPLVPGLNPWRSPPGDAPVHAPETYDWDFTTLSRHAGASVPSPDDQSWTAILVDHRDSPSPTIYAYALACC